MDNRKRLRPWLWRHTENGNFGLKWIDKEEEIFRIPWVHRSSRSWNKDHCQVFKEWAKFTMKYKEGDDEDYPGWKTRLRTALTKLNRDFEEIPELHRMEDPVDPYKVYRFKNIDSQRDTTNCPTTPSDSPISSDCVDGSPGGFSPFPSPCSNFQQSANPGHLAGNIPNILEPSTEGIVSQSRSNIVPAHQCDHQPFVDILEQQASLTDAEMPSLPSDLVGLDSGNLALHEKLASNEISNYKEDTNLENSEMPLFPLQPSDKPTVLYEVSYLNNVVKTGTLYSNPYLFHFGEIPEVKCSSNVFGPQGTERIELPDVTNITRSINAQQQSLIQNILLQMDRGFLLQCYQGDIYVQRLCRTRLFASSPTMNNQLLDRQSKSALKIFDLAHFRENHLDQDKRPPVTILTFAQELDLYKTVLMQIKLTSEKAKTLLPLSSGQGSSLQFSDFNSGDVELMHQMCSLALENK